MKIIIFNYLFSNGDAHIKNFSLLETPLGDFRLSPAYDLLNSRIHVEGKDFALEGGLLPKNLARGKIKQQLFVLAREAGIKDNIFEELLSLMLSGSERVQKLVNACYLDESTKRNYWQAYQTKLKKLAKD